MANIQATEKYKDLIEILKGYGSIVVAFSSGVDSTLLLYAAKEALGDKVIAATATSCTFPERERNEAVDFCKNLGVRHVVIETDELATPGFKENPKDRCYICKKSLFQNFIDLAEKEGFAAVVEGSNADDEGDYRPGLKAIAELDIKSPLRAAKLTKAEIRALSEEFDLPTYNKPSYACLASRFPYGELITKEKLALVDKGEQLLYDLGFKQFRVRIHGNSNFVARIELLPEDFGKLMEPALREKISAEFKAFGFAYTSLDLKGYRTGSMNETL
ncbi:ATP-dependent sacrificial sulfur transferase LarE [Butyrivibrio sp. MC2021]|uniref:ATP-dependent sacrificial sulfur transferase LarE n=1 Tax=Butyrivibrio sp. MC2021 TaxID=1408306 RepID=UPI000479F71B|nr:ATP-dependent sacrificial sulfur transferase LarE [Butyrivibrio sp. MC2021]